jgi:hypothetical protein
LKSAFNGLDQESRLRRSRRQEIFVDPLRIAVGRLTDAHCWEIEAEGTGGKGSHTMQLAHIVLDYRKSI